MENSGALILAEPRLGRVSADAIDYGVDGGGQSRVIDEALEAGRRGEGDGKTVERRPLEREIGAAERRGIGDPAPLPGGGKEAFGGCDGKVAHAFEGYPHNVEGGDFGGRGVAGE